jgi:hypothetical protein
MLRVNWSHRMTAPARPSGDLRQASSSPAIALSISAPKRRRISSSNSGVLFHQISRGLPCPGSSSGRNQKSRMSRMSEFAGGHGMSFLP